MTLIDAPPAAAQQPPPPPTTLAQPTNFSRTLEYAGPHTARPSGRGGRFLVFALALAAAVLGANAFADAAGFDPGNFSRRPELVFVRVLCGIVVFIVAVALIGASVRAIAWAVDALARTPARPGLPVTLTLIGCGTACVLAMLVVEALAMRSAARAELMGMTDGTLGLDVHTATPLAIHLATLAAFVAGATMLALGVWSSLGRTSGGSRA